MKDIIKKFNKMWLLSFNGKVHTFSIFLLVVDLQNPNHQNAFELPNKHYEASSYMGLSLECSLKNTKEHFFTKNFICHVFLINNNIR